MKVFFGHQIFDSQTVEGASRYFVELADHLVEEGVDVEFAVRETDNEFLLKHPVWSKQVVLAHRKIPVPAYVWRVIARLGLDYYLATNRENRRASLQALARGEFDVFQPTYYEPYFLNHLGGKPFVLTVHDMIHELFPEYVKRGNPTSRWKRLLVDRAAHIIAVSQCTKNDLVRIWDINPERVTVIHHGVGLPFTAVAHDPSIIKTILPAGVTHYLLFVGNRGRYKNFDVLVEAMPAIVRQYPTLYVVCVGGGGFNAQERSSIAKGGMEKHFIQVSANDDELAALYRGAKAFIFPSKYEGFGLPILEAFASGCPVIASRASVFPEVAGEAAVYFDPASSHDLARVIVTLLDSQSLRDAMRRRGCERLVHFTWEETAKKTLEIYQKALCN